MHPYDSTPGQGRGIEAFLNKLDSLSPVEKYNALRNMTGPGRAITAGVGLDNIRDMSGGQESSGGGFPPVPSGGQPRGMSGASMSGNDDYFKGEAIRRAMGLVEPGVSPHQYQRMETGVTGLEGPPSQGAEFPYEADRDIVISDSTGQRVGDPATMGKNFTRVRVNQNPAYAQGKDALEASGKELVERFWPDQQKLAAAKNQRDQQELIMKMMAGAEGDIFDARTRGAEALRQTNPDKATTDLGTARDNYRQRLQQIGTPNVRGVAPSGPDNDPATLGPEYTKAGRNPEAVEKAIAEWWAQFGSGGVGHY